MQFGIGVVLARILSPRDFGLVGMVVVFTGLADLISELGLGAALIQRKDIEQRHLNSVFWVNMSLGLLLTVLFMAGSPLIVRFYQEPAILGLTLAISFNFLIGSLSVIQNSILMKALNFRKLAIIELSSTLTAGTVAITMALLGMGFWSLAAQSLTLTATTAACLWLSSSWRPSLSFDRKALKDLLGFSSNLLGFNMLNYFAQ